MVEGGPGALFWMWIAALVGTATKYSECLLAIKYRVVAEDGHIIGGPFYYIEKGMGPKWKWLGKLFAFFGVGVGSVSYTHLDVYKRQARECARAHALFRALLA